MNSLLIHLNSLPQPPGGNPPNYYSQPVADSAYGGDLDGYIAKFSPDMELLWSTYLFTRNSSADDYISSIASDGGNRLYFAGWVGKDDNYNDSHTIPYQDYSILESDWYQQFRSSPYQYSEGILGLFDSLKLDNTAEIIRITSDKENMKIFPIPGNNVINILMPTTMRDGQLEVLNLLGQQLYINTYFNGNSVKLDISHFIEGAFILKVQDSKHCFTSKFVKQ